MDMPYLLVHPNIILHKRIYTIWETEVKRFPLAGVGEEWQDVD